VDGMGKARDAFKIHRGRVTVPDGQGGEEAESSENLSHRGTTRIKNFSCPKENAVLNAKI